MSPSTPGSRETIEALFADATAGDRRALARLITLVERGGPEAIIASSVVYPHGGNTAVVGMTGAPGSGKSTLTNALLTTVRKSLDHVAVLAIDPSSPFTGGAILGDRIRMGDRSLDDGIYIRSLATRGHLGGLSLATPAATDVLDAVGYPLVLIETVGVGQVEVEIIGTADTCVVVLNPGWGDAIQANKAGLMEIADVFVINKADRDGAGDTYRDLTQMLMMRPQVEGGWEPPVISTVATNGDGCEELWAAIKGHQSWLVESGTGERRRRERTADRLRMLMSAELARRSESLGNDDAFWAQVDEVLDRRLDPWSAARQALSSLT